MPSGLSDNEQTTFFMRSPVVDDVHAAINAASPGSDDMPLMNQKRQAEMDKLLQRGQSQDEQQDEQQVEQQVEQQDTPSEDRFPDIGDFASVSSLGDAEMEAITQIDFETFGREPERPGDEWIGYPPGRPRKKKREEDEANAQAQGQSQAQAQAHARAQIRVSAHNIEYPPLPAAFVRQTAQSAVQTTGLANQRVAGEALEALARASEWYFRQLGDDLSAYANHANRRTIEERDVVALMHR
jgi:histone H3/H4